MEEKERYKYREVSNEVEHYECYWDNKEACELFDDETVLNRLNEQDFELKKLNQENINLIEENQQLKQQLHDLPKKIVEEIRDDMSKRIIEKQIKWGDNIQIGFICNAINECLDTILKKYGGEDE